jgi:hypothetical protein
MKDCWELNEIEFSEAVTEFVRRAGTQKAAAERIGVSEQYLCDVLQGRRKPGPKLVAGMGYTKVTYYQRERVS